MVLSGAGVGITEATGFVFDQPIPDKFCRGIGGMDTGAAVELLF
jgi:hypothetical protein